jgi:hypothetical protein
MEALSADVRAHGHENALVDGPNPFAARTSSSRA